MSTDSSSRVGRTAVQVSVPAALVAIGSWAARLAGLDLDPGPGVDMPAEVVGAFVTVLTVGLALAMNRGKGVTPGEVMEQVLADARARGDLSTAWNWRPPEDGGPSGTTVIGGGGGGGAGGSSSGYIQFVAEGGDEA